MHQRQLDVVRQGTEQRTARTEQHGYDRNREVVEQPCAEEALERLTAIHIQVTEVRASKLCNQRFDGSLERMNGRCQRHRDRHRRATHHVHRQVPVWPRVKRQDTLKRVPPHDQPVDGRDELEIPAVLALGEQRLRGVEPVEAAIRPGNVAVEAGGDERMFGSIRSVTGASLTALDYLSTQPGPPLAVRDWVRHGRGVLFLPYQANEIAALRSIISAWLRLAIFQTMSGGEADQRLWFIVDELDALGPIDGLKDALARLRKFGGRCVLGFQSIAQVSSTYGHGEAQTIVENCSNSLILRCAASENGGTARFASKLIGEREVIRPTVSRTRRSGFLVEPHHSVSRGEQHVTEAAVLPAEVEQLPDLSGYLKFASQPAWLRVRLPIR